MTNPSEKPLPAGWKRVKLGEVVVNVQPGFACGERSVDGVIQLRMNNVGTDGNCNWSEITRIPSDFKDMSKYWLRPGDVLFNNTNSAELVGKSALFLGFTEEMVFSNHFSRITSNPENLLPGFLAKWLIATWAEGTFAGMCNRWIGQASIPRQKLLEMSIPLPPLPEQRRIVAHLDQQMALAEKARLVAEEMLQNISSLKAAFLREILP